MAVSFAGESVYSVGVRVSVARVGRRWRNFGCAGSEFRTEGGDPGEKCFTLTRKESGRKMPVSCWGQKGDSSLHASSAIGCHRCWFCRTCSHRSAAPARSCLPLPSTALFRFSLGITITRCPRGQLERESPQSGRRKSSSSSGNSKGSTPIHHPRRRVRGILGF